MRHFPQLRVCLAARPQPIQPASAKHFAGRPWRQRVPFPAVVLCRVPGSFLVLLRKCVPHQLRAGLEGDLAVNAVVRGPFVRDRVQQQRVGQVDSFFS